MLNTWVVWSLWDSHYQQELLKVRDEPIKILKCSSQWDQSTVKGQHLAKYGSETTS